jgi:uncharacterized phiE125 gp8 family phage protein
MGLVRTVAPAARPLATALVRTHCRIDGVDEDTLLEALLDAAVDEVESYLVRALCPQTWRLTLDAFPADDGAIRLKRPPVLEVVSITYVDEEGEEQALAADQYELDLSAFPPEVVLAYGASWPAARAQRNAVTVTFRAGYEDDSGEEPVPAVPGSIRSALLLLVGDLYAHRERQFVGTIVTENPTARALLGGYLYREAV